MSKKAKRVKKQILSEDKVKVPKKNFISRIIPKVQEDFWKLSFEKDAEKWRKPFIVLNVLCLLFFLGLATQAGINGDDDVQVQYSEDLLEFYSTLGKDQTVFERDGLHDGTLHLYGGFFEISSAVINRIFGFAPNEKAYFDVRHLLVALMGYFTVLFCGLIARLAGGFKTATFAVVALMLTPRFLGHSLMNPKDIPFAMGYAMSIFYSLKLLNEIPKPKINTIILAGIGAGISLAIRVGGLLSFAYIALFMAIHYLFTQYGKNLFDRKKLWLYLKSYLIVFSVGFTFALVFWPYALINPIDHISEALTVFSDFIVNIKVLFSGQMVWSGDIPLEYLTTWLFLGTPSFSILGLLLLLIFAKGIYNNYNTIVIGVVAFAFVFPVVYALAKGSALYDGMRHFLFAYVMGITLTAVAWDFLLEKLEKFNKKAHLLGTLILGLTLLEPALFTIRNYTYPYVFFNTISGGINNAFGKYELDYWGLSARQAIEWMKKEGLLDTPEGQTLTVASNFPDPISIYAKKYIDSGKLRVIYSRYRERYDQKWDYGIFVSRFMDGAYIRAGSWPSGESIHNISVNGKAISSIYKSTPESFAFTGVQASKSGDSNAVIAAMEQEITIHPDNEIAWQELSTAYLNLRQMQNAKNAIDKSLQLNPENIIAYNNLGMYYLQINEINEASKTFENALKFNNKNTLALYYLAVIYRSKNNLEFALDYAKKAVESNPGYKASFQLTAEIYRQMGNNNMADSYLRAMNQ